MTINKDSGGITIKFEKQDWNSSKAKKTIDFVKELKSIHGKPLAYYQQFAKSWKVIKTPYTERKLDEFISEFEDHQNRVEFDQVSLFDKHWEEVERRNEI